MHSLPSGMCFSEKPARQPLFDFNTWKCLIFPPQTPTFPRRHAYLIEGQEIDVTTSSIPPFYMAVCLISSILNGAKPNAVASGYRHQYHGGLRGYQRLTKEGPRQSRVAVLRERDSPPSSGVRADLPYVFHRSTAPPSMSSRSIHETCCASA